MKRRWKIIGTLGLVAVIGGALVVVSGVIPVKASSGHWEITRWFLNFTKERSVATHSTGIKVPDLEDRALIIKGAGHYETGCRVCHGKPDSVRPRLVSLMTPQPPDLQKIVPQREPQELFYVVKHGIKMTGMPAWPELKRDDEIWPVVAFLLQYSELDLAEYDELVWGEHQKQSDQSIDSAEGTSLPVPHLVIEECAGCHGVDGQGRGLGVFPRLAGQNEAYLRVSLEAYHHDNRLSGTMEVIASRMNQKEIQEISRYYSRLPPFPSKENQNGEASSNRDSEAEVASFERGAEIAAEGIADQDVPACADCHSTTRKPFKNAYPTLIGQYQDYLALQIKLFQNRNRGGSKSANLMHAAVDGLKPDQIRDVSYYYSVLPDKE
ncbi:c-type cytochrome [Gimesia sp.]|uniref:c-type cytochrome n=1 Tax=Gimesia sp. TaxID=2024833 RepID=UPI000C4AEA7C|nr:c-type cytochrome [Gimesia sp.]MAX38253.1 cytochrome C [Gimesia sp.]HBL43953.1 cytochrome C [Planctomycetaceae bacterium]|tara:strand:- start:19946 stop:21085 length:1140 start_codon:yes stop_codon:yes gene_type:complete